MSEVASGTKTAAPVFVPLRVVTSPVARAALLVTTFVFSEPSTVSQGLSTHFLKMSIPLHVSFSLNAKWVLRYPYR